jgi:hypothetical protein
MAAPFDVLPDAVPVLAPDEVMRATLARATGDWRRLPSTIALSNIRKWAGCRS